MGIKLRVTSLLALLVIVLWTSTYAYGLGTIETVSTLGYGDHSVVCIDVRGYSTHKVIPVGEREILIALKDMGISDQVYTHEAILGDPFIRGIEVVERPFHVVSLNLQLRHPHTALDLNLDQGPDGLRVEIRHKDGQGAQGLETIGPSRSDSGKREGTETKVDKVKEPNPSKGQITEDDRLFLEAEKGRRNGDWGKAIAAYEKIIRTHPRSPHLEASYFGVATTTHRKFENDIADHLLEIAHRYQTALSRFPRSNHIPRAMLSLGRLYRQAGRYLEAMTYYDLLLKKDLHDGVRAEALFYKGVILSRTKRPLMALRAFEEITEAYGSSNFGRKAKLETAKTLYDMKSFKRSLETLNEIVSERPNAVYETSDVLLYTAYNQYELGRLEAARDAFSRVINYFPEMEEREMVLTRIADTFREDGLEEKAGKLYGLVARTYPESEAGIISLLRLGEISEAAETRQPLVVAETASRNVTSKTATQIYQEIIETYPKSPLSQVAMLKLAGLQKRNEDYAACIDTLSTLLAGNPEPGLRGNIEKVMQDAKLKLAARQRARGNHEASVETVASMLADYPDARLSKEVRGGLAASLVQVLQEKHRRGGAEAAISYFEERKDDIPVARMRGVLLEAGMAYRELHLCKHAVSALVAARRLNLDKDLSAKFLWGLGECSYRTGQYDLARDVLSAYVSENPDEGSIPSAYLWLGNIHMAEGGYQKALDAFKQGLQKAESARDRTELLAATGKALSRIGDYQGAVKPLNQVLSMLEADSGHVSPARFDTYRELGKAYSRLGETSRAVEAFEQALRLRPEGAEAYGLQFEIAKCYQSIAPGKAKSVLTEIVASGDPFWSKVAQARINEIEVQRSVDRLGINRS